MSTKPKRKREREEQVITYLGQPMKPTGAGYQKNGPQRIIIARGAKLLAMRELGSNVLTMSACLDESDFHFKIIRQFT